MRNTESSHLSREPRCSGGWAGVPNSYYTDTPGLLLYFRFATPAPGQTALFACGDAVHSAGQGGNAAAALRNIARRSHPRKGNSSPSLRARPAADHSNPNSPTSS